MTPTGFAALKAELADLKAERPKISLEIGEATVIREAASVGPRARRP